MALSLSLPAKLFELVPATHIHLSSYFKMLSNLPSTSAPLLKVDPLGLAISLPVKFQGSFKSPHFNESLGCIQY